MEKTNRNSEEKFITYWLQKKKLGFANYFIVGFLGCIAFFFFAEAIACFIVSRTSIEMIEIIIFVILSAIIPTIAWFVNDARYNKVKGKYDDFIKNIEIQEEKAEIEKTSEELPEEVVAASADVMKEDEIVESDSDSLDEDALNDEETNLKEDIEEEKL